jgi:hypothetical protein
MKAIVQMTGPHPSQNRSVRFPKMLWRVSLVASDSRAPIGPEYRCLSYRRAVLLACDMAHDRRLFLHLKALPA